jgi:hypothetical protein
MSICSISLCQISCQRSRSDGGHCKRSLYLTWVSFCNILEFQSRELQTSNSTVIWKAVSVKFITRHVTWIFPKIQKQWKFPSLQVSSKFDDQLNFSRTSRVPIKLFIESNIHFSYEAVHLHKEESMIPITTCRFESFCKFK